MMIVLLLFLQKQSLVIPYVPITLSSDAGYADLPLTLLGDPVDIGALLKPGSRSPGAVFSITIGSQVIWQYKISEL
jgi:hypothetical protein